MRDDWRQGNSRGVAILRVSSQRQKDNISHDVQEREIREYCVRNRIVITDLFRIVESAKDSDNRKKFTAAINTALTKDIRHLLFYMYDREARNLTDNERNEKLVQAGLIVIHYVRENKILHQGSPDSEFFIRDVQAAANKQFVRNLRAKVGDAMRQKAEQGWYPGNHPPLGYAHQKLRDSEGRELKRGTTIVKDPVEATVKLVQREFELRAQGFPVDHIRKATLKEGLVSPKRRPNYSKPALHARLKNPFYWGRFRWGKELYDGKHELIIPKGDLERVEAINGGRRVSPAGLKNGIFSGGFIRCASCECHVIYDPKRKVYRTLGTEQVFHYYHCSNGKRAHETLRGMNVSEDSLWEQFNQAVDAITLTPSLAREIAQELNASDERAQRKAKDQIAHYEGILGALEGKEQAAYDDLKSDVLDVDGFKAVTLKIRSDRQAAQATLGTLRGVSSRRLRETAASTLELCIHAKDLYLSRSPVERRNLLERLVSNPRLEGVTLRFDLRSPFSVLAKMKENEEWCALVEQFRTDLVAITEF